MAYTTIDDPSVYFQIALYTGNDSSNAITNDGNSDLQPDWLWTKNRSSSADHKIFDSTRGVTKFLESNTNDAEGTQANLLSSFNSDGFTLGAGGETNSSSTNYVAWQWKANGGSRTTFTESGDNPGGGYQANTTAGFSIVDFVGTGANGTVQHGLGVAPRWYIIKNRDRSANWQVYHEDNGNTHYIKLNGTGAKLDNHEIFNDTSPTSSVFSVGIDQSVNFNGENHIAYVFAEIQGYSKFGSYTGNGNADGPFVYTGFKPAWLLIRRTDSAQNWNLHDNKRSTFNTTKADLFPNLSNAEETGNGNFIDFLSNGFKHRASTNSLNASSGDFIYMAFAQHPFVSSKGVPVTAN
tara:strand:- start:844 stop:1896 length:1053 start_codon:yes stop_codon:yes gene_type:complete